MFVGIDLGTSSVKLILTDNLGNIINTITKKYDLIIEHESWSEQNPNDWFESTKQGLKELIIGNEHNIISISFSGQMHGLVLLDEQDEIIRNAILWNDQRTTKEVDYLNNVIGKEILMEETGNIALTGLTLPKLLWVKHNELANYNKIAKVMLPKDYLIYKLSSVFASDVSDLSGTLYFDVKNKKYSKKMLKLLDLSIDHFPKVLESSDVVGELNNEMKQYLKITNDVKIVAGGGDQAVGAIGLGIVNDNDISISLGTSGVVFISSDQFKPDKKSYLQSYCHANGKYHLMSVMLNAAGSLNWFCNKVINDDNYDLIFEEIAKLDLNEKLYFLPYLAGERATINDPFARGSFVNLHMKHTKYHLIRSVIEGVSFGIKESIDQIEELGLHITKARITGGGSKSEFWCQLLSDILNIEMETIAIDEGPALGAAILAMVGAKEYSSVSDACDKVVKPNKTYIPNVENHLIYKQKYHQYLKLYPLLKTMNE